MDRPYGSCNSHAVSQHGWRYRYRYPKGVDPPWGSRIYAIGVLESRIGGSVFWDPARALGCSQHQVPETTVLTGPSFGVSEAGIVYSWS